MNSVTTERIIELRATVPHLDIDEIGVSGDNEAAVKAVLNHFRSVAHQFADPEEKGECINCDRQQGGIMGAFSWGIIHGEGACICGWPARAYHFIEIDGDKTRVEVLLQYHPDGVRKSQAA